MAEQRKPSGLAGCFRWGCLGCLGLVVLLMLLGGVVLGIGFLLGPPDEKLVRPVLTRELPAAEPGDASTDRGESVEIGELPPPADLPGRVVLDLSEGSFRIMPAPPGEPLKVEGRYDSGVYELEESLERPEGEGWIYSVRFERRVSWMRVLFSEKEQENRVDISLPRGVPIVLEGVIGVGESVLELGGLSIRKLDLDLGTGSHQIRFSEPAPLPMERFALKSGIGELLVHDLGNASPRGVKISHRIGEVNIGLKGAWLNDAEIGVSCGIGECIVLVPDDVGLEVGSATIGLGEVSGGGREGSRPAGPGEPTLRLDLSGKIGEVRVTR
jgi:hypothetical protein